ncbi:RIP metalloprotease RseP [bacterium]|nr:RIP metalloprotease RseP [bacterium]
MFYTIIIFILVLSVLVFAHEFGHFWVARKSGVKAEEFGIGFPPRLFGVYKSKGGKWKTFWGRKEINDAIDTIYSVNWIPLGGFVKIKGENGENKDDKDSFSSKPAGIRALILSAGVLMNILIAMVFISVGYMIGFPGNINGLPEAAKVSDYKVQVMEVIPDSPAEEAELQVGDVVSKVNNVDIVSEEDLQNEIAKFPGKEVNLTVFRQNEMLNVLLTPDDIEGEGRMGVAIVATGVISYPWYQAIWEGIRTTLFFLWAIIIGFISLIKNLIISAPINAEVAGPIGIADLTGRFARMGFVYLLQFSALLSLNLAVLNILPFPALDGGRLIFVIIEKIKGKPVKKEVEAAIHNLGFLLLMVLVLFVTFKDVARFF